MTFLKVAAIALAAQVAYGQVDPPGTAFPESTFPDFVDPFFAAGAKSNQLSDPFYPSPWTEGMGDWAEAYQKATALVKQMTIIEKVNLTTGVGWQSDKCVGNTGSLPRLGLKALCLEDSPLGVRFADLVSAFEAGVTVAATWDRNLFRERGLFMGQEHQGKGVDIQLGPVVGPLGRKPEGGRNWEGFSPDPVLAGIAVSETVQGIQSAGIMSNTKHYILNEQEHFRQGGTNLSDAISSNLDDITMHELYLWPFADAVRAGTATIMCSYNQINNSYGCQNSQTLNKLLKAELNFQGPVISDWSAQHSGVSAALAGLDMTMPGDVSFNSATSFWGSNLTIAVLNGTVPQWRLDDMVTRIVAAWYYVGRDQHQAPNAPNFSAWTTNTTDYQYYYAKEDVTQVNYHVNVQDAHAVHIRNASARGTVLLKNKGNLLPLKGNEKLTGVFGYDAIVNPDGANACSDRGCDNGTLAMGYGSGTANFPYLVGPLHAITQQVKSKGGAVASVASNYAYAKIEAVAAKVGAAGGPALVFVNADSGEGYITVDGNEGDRNNLTLWGEGDTLIKTVAKHVKHTIVVMHTTGPCILTGFNNHPNVSAILWAALPGQESGNSLVDVLYGKINPSGKLPFTIGASRHDYGVDVIYEPNNGAGAPQDNFQEGVFIDYRAYDKHGITPTYEFGFGLSYTTFKYSSLNVQSVPAGAYMPTTGKTPRAPTFGKIDKSIKANRFPAGFNPVPYYIYPYLNGTSLKKAAAYPGYGVPYKFPAHSSDAHPQDRLPASGAPGGNPGLYDVLYRVSATVQNTGRVDGEEVAQVYVCLGGPNDPLRALRGFDKLNIPAGGKSRFTVELTRRDLSNWDPATQNWYISKYPKTVYVGSSSRKLPLNAPLPASGYYAE